MNFSNVAVGIKTFLRDEKATIAVNGVTKNMPGAQIVMVDDGHVSSEKLSFYDLIRRSGHCVVLLPFDSGFGRKSNVIAILNIKPYLLIGSDDFDFTPEAADGVTKLVSVLESNPDIDIASGRVNNRAYEFFLEEEDGVVRETPLEFELNGRGQAFIECDLTVNYSLVRVRVLDKVRWDDDVKIGGGEHGAWFLDAKRAGFKTVFVPGVNINEQQYGIPDSTEYRRYRARARGKARPCFDRRGVREYWLGNGSLDYRRADAVHN